MILELSQSTPSPMPRHPLLIHAIGRTDDLSKAQKKLLIAIARNTRVLSKGVVISVATLAKETGYSSGYVSLLSTQAVKKGYLSRSTHFIGIDGTLYPSCNRYELTLPDSLVALGRTH